MAEQVSLAELELLKENKCPDCKGTDWVSGPTGGLSQNVTCKGCGSQFNILGGAFGVERIGPWKPKPPAVGPYR